MGKMITASSFVTVAASFTLIFSNNIPAAGPNAPGIPSPSETAAVAAQLDPFIPVDDIVSNPLVPLADPEFDENGGNWVTWQLGPIPQTQNKGLLLVARLDPDTGDLLDPDTGVSLTQGGHGKVIDQGVVTRDITKNGPEWASAVGGSRLLYSKLNDNNEPSIAQAVFDGSQWITGILPYGRNRFTPEGSKDPDDSNPRVAYLAYVNAQTPELRLAMRSIDQASTERIAPSKIDGYNFIPGESAMLGTIRAPDGLQQVVYWDYVVGNVEQITSDYGSKGQTPESFRAPELGNEVAFVAQVQFLNSTIGRVYTRVTGAGGSPTWVPYMQFISPDPNKPFIGGTRPFVYQGKTYISFKVQPARGNNLGVDFYLIDLEPDPNLRLVRKLSDDQPRFRYDQEFYFTTQGPVIYYSEVTPTGIHVLHRCQTGIGP